MGANASCRRECLRIVQQIGEPLLTSTPLAGKTFQGGSFFSVKVRTRKMKKKE
jgi:hypothetical protein